MVLPAHVGLRPSTYAALSFFSSVSIRTSVNPPRGGRLRSDPPPLRVSDTRGSLPLHMAFSAASHGQPDVRAHPGAQSKRRHL